MLDEKKVHLWIKRDELIHPVISGNKYRKLSYLIPLLQKKAYPGILTFGGLYSNHIHALAWLCHSFNIPLTVLVRSYDPAPRSPTLEDIEKWGADIRIVSPSEYREKDSHNQISVWQKEFPGYHIVPEGGSHVQALEGVRKMMEEIGSVLADVDIFYCPIGTGATIAGMILNKNQLQNVIGVSVLKSSDIFREVGIKWKLKEYRNWMVTDQWHFGGYGQITNELTNFINWFEQQHSILLDPLYNGKSMYAFYQHLRFDLIPPGSKVVFIHTGGLQGWRGFRQSV